MPPLRHLLGLAALLLVAARAWAQPVYYCTSSTTLPSNTVDSVATNGTGQATLITATGIDLNKINRCTAVAVDALNGKLFLADAQTRAIFSANLNGSGLTLLKSGLAAFPTDLALDVLNQQIYFTTSSTIQTNNTIERMDYSGSNLTTLLIAGVAPATSIAHCTALAVDIPKGKLFLVDGSSSIWSMNLNGSSLASLATVSTSGAFPTGLALDSTNQQVYFSVSSTVQSANTIQRVNYNGTGLTTRFTASGSVQRCTALDLDPAAGVVYLSDAMANSLWRIPLATGTPAAVLSLPATAKKVRWFNAGATNRPPPALTGLQFSGSGSANGPNLVFNVTNGFIGGTYYLLTSTNLGAPLTQWQPVATNILGASGNFSLTLSNLTRLPGQFYVLRVQ